MSLITDVWRQMVRRRLWPLAVLLLGALVAVPVVLAKDPAPSPAPSPAAAAPAAEESALSAKPVVVLADDTSARRRRVLGVRKNLFQPAPPPKAKKSTASQPAASANPSGTGGTPAGKTPVASGGGSPVAGSPGTVVPVKPKHKSYPGDSLTVRFGSGSGDDPKTVLESEQGLPQETADSATPLLVYVGLAKNGTEALFLVDASVQADGDGHCEGDGATDCELLHMRAGDTEFLDVVDETGKVTDKFQLDLLAIHPSKRTVAAAKAAKAKAAKARAAKRLAHAASAATANIAPGAVRVSGLARLLAGF